MKKLSALSVITAVSALALGSSALAADVTTVNIAGVTGKKPYTYVDDDGNYTGYDFEVLKLIDEKLEEYEFNYTALEQDALLVGLQSGKYDLATCSFYGTK